jgi:hypothetical protein
MGAFCAEECAVEPQSRKFDGVAVFIEHHLKKKTT